MQHSSTDFTQKLISRAISLREEAVSELFEKTYAEVYCTIRALVRDENVTRDCLRETYINAFRGLRILEAPEQFPDFVRRIAHTTSIAYLAKQTPALFSRMLIDQEEIPDFDDEFPPELPDIDMEERVAEALVLDLMRTLPEDQRVCTVLYYYERRDALQIAQELGISQNTVLSCLNYSKWKVKARVRELERYDVNLYGFKTRYAIPFMVFLFGKYEQIIAKKQVPSELLQDIVKELRQSSAAAMYAEEEEREAARLEAVRREKKAKRASAGRKKRIGIAVVLFLVVALLAAAVTILAIRAHRLQKQISYAESGGTAGGTADGGEGAGAGASGSAGNGASDGQNESGAAGSDFAQFAQGTSGAASGEADINFQLPDAKFIDGNYSEKENMTWMEIKTVKAGKNNKKDKDADSDADADTDTNAKADADSDADADTSTSTSADAADTYKITFHGKTKRNKDFEETYTGKSDGNQIIVDSGTDAGTAATLRWVNEYTVSVTTSAFFEDEKNIVVGGVYLSAATPMRGGNGIDAYLGVWTAMADSSINLTMQMSAGALHMSLTDGGETKSEHTYSSFQVEQGVNGLPSKLRCHLDGKEDETYWLYPDGTITFHSEESEYSGTNFKQSA